MAERNDTRPDSSARDDGALAGSEYTAAMRSGEAEADKASGATGGVRVDSE